MSVTAAPMVDAPERSYTQRMEALERANVIRTHRAGVKRDVRAGRRSAREILAAPEEELLNMKVADVLLAIPHWGRVKVQKRLTQARVSMSKTVGGLTERQRQELLAMLS